MNSIDQVIASIRNARVEIKATAAAARASAPKGEKMVAGQHATATAAHAIAVAAIPSITASGWVPASVTVNKAGTDIAVHYRRPVTLAERTQVWQNAAARRAALRAAKKTAPAPVVAAIPTKNAALAALDVALNGLRQQAAA